MEIKVGPAASGEKWLHLWNEGKWVPAGEICFQFGEHATVHAKRWDAKEDAFEFHTFVDCVLMGKSWSFGDDWRPLYVCKPAPADPDMRSEASKIEQSPFVSFSDLRIEEMKADKLDEILKRLDAIAPLMAPTVLPADCYILTVGHIGWAMEVMKFGQCVRRRSWASDMKIWLGNFSLNDLDVIATDWEIAK